MTYGGGGGMATGEEIDSIRNWDRSSFSSRRESWIDETDDPSVIRPESVEESRLGLPTANLMNTFSNIYKQTFLDTYVLKYFNFVVLIFSVLCMTIFVFIYLESREKTEGERLEKS